MEISLQQFIGICPNAKDPQKITDLLNQILPEYGITTRKQTICFLAQTAHECALYTKFKENLNYSAEGLHATWGKRFPTVESAKPYHRNPEKIANKVYANRLGNGDEASGDGWKYIGKGIVQLTGKENQQHFASAIKKSLDEAVKYLDTIEGCIESGAWFWKERNLNALVDDYEALTKAINGGLIGLDERTKLKEKLEKVI
jgi:putative chitinase